MFSAGQYSYLKPVRTLEDDFPFLFKVIEFRILLLGLSKEEREKYSKLWFAREKKLAAKSFNQSELKRENERYIHSLINQFNIDINQQDQFIQIHQSSLLNDLRKLTRDKLSGNILKDKENTLLLELTSWINETEDDVLIPFLTASIEKIIERGVVLERMQFFSYYPVKANVVFSLLDSETHNNINLKSLLAWNKLSTQPSLTFYEFFSAKGENALYHMAGFSLMLIGVLCIRSSLSERNNDIGLRYLGIVSLSASFFLALIRSCCIGRGINHLADPGKFSENFGEFTALFFKNVIEDLFAKQQEPHYQSKPADLPELVSILHSCSFLGSKKDEEEQEEKQGKKPEKIKTRRRRLLNLSDLNQENLLADSSAPVQSNDKDVIDAEITYIHLSNNHYAKLDSEKLRALWKAAYPKESSDSFFEDVSKQVKRDRGLDKLLHSETSGQKAQFRGCTHKLRVNTGLYPRVGFYSRQPTQNERDASIEDEVYSPKCIVIGHKKGYAL